MILPSRVALLVEDNDQVAMLVREMHQELGYQVERVGFRVLSKPYDLPTLATALQMVRNESSSAGCGQ